MCDYFFKTKEALRIGDNCLLYQDEKAGGFPKNIYIPQMITDFELLDLKNKKQRSSYCSIDNGATTTEIDYLSKLYHFYKDDKYKNAAIKGINYLISSQYQSGGWKQCQPYTQSSLYQQNITYNDNAMVNVLKLLKLVASKSYPYDFVDDELSGRAQKSFDKGINCILKTQIIRNGVKTAWCAQYDKTTLKPAKGRPYEYPSISGGRESVGILLLLMSIDNPPKEIEDAIHSGVKWFENSKIEGVRADYFIDSEENRDYAMIKCNDCPPLWARCYEIQSNKPIFSSRKGNYVYDISKISQERRNGYEWYSSEGLNLLREYKKWQKKHKFN